MDFVALAGGVGVMSTSSSEFPRTSPRATFIVVVTLDLSGVEKVKEEKSRVTSAPSSPMVIVERRCSLDIGDKAEGYMLKIYRLKPHVGKRRALSAASVKEKLYDAALGKETSWKVDVPESIAKIIEENWETVKKFANSEDATTRVAGMKFPKQGWSK